jgi:hypothetical protein
MEALQQQSVIWFRLRISGKDEQSVVCGWQVNVNHLDGGHLLDHGSAGEPGGQSSQPLL